MDLTQRESESRSASKKVFYLDPMVPVNVKYNKFSRAPRNHNSGLVGPHTTPPIVEIKYMPSTPREEGTLGCPRSGLNIINLDLAQVSRS